MSSAPSRLLEAQQLAASGQMEAALRIVAQVAASESPDDVAGAVGVYSRLGRAPAGVVAAAAALQRHPDHIPLLQSYVEALTVSGRAAETIGPLQRLASLTPGDPIVSARLAHALSVAGRLAEAADLCRIAFASSPGNPALAVVNFNIMTLFGEPELAWKPLEFVGAAVPDNPDLLSNLAATANSATTASPEAIFEFHAAYGRAIQRRRPGSGPALDSDRNPDRPLQIGVVSYDLRRDASVGFFLRPIFDHLDRSEFRLVAYQTRPLREPDTASFRAARADDWRSLADGDTDGLARQIRQDRIDIVLEINGHSGVRTLPALVPRCAPVQVSYLGYSNTSGVPTMDWRIVDSTTDPAPAADRLATERLWRLDPCFLCYAPGDDHPPPAPMPPCSRAGHITFGAFSELGKLNDEVLAIWGRVLRSAPGSRLLLKNRAAEIPAVLERFRSRLARAGLGPARVEIAPRVYPFPRHLTSYDRIDIALDTSPYTGTTTVCESLCMGVPLVTFAPPARHDRHAARVAMSILKAAGMPDLIARDADDFVALAADLARDPGRLITDRGSLRARFLASPVCDGPGFARRLGGALREMWRGYCAGAAAIPVPPGR